MTGTTAAICGVKTSGGRRFSSGKKRRGAPVIVKGAVFGLATVAAAGALVTTVTVTAAWILNNSHAHRVNRIATMPVAPATLALAEHYPMVASADVTGSIRPADPADSGTFAAKWAYATAPIDAAPLLRRARGGFAAVKRTASAAKPAQDSGCERHGLDPGC